MKEIERRFLITRIDPDALARGTAQPIRQGYLATEDPEVRIRARGGEFFLTFKRGEGLVREEIEMPAPDEVGAALLRMAGARAVEKTRHVLGRWEVDVFAGKLAGLLLAEIELEEESEELPPPPAGVALGREVTEDARFRNRRLALLAPDEARRLVDEIQSHLVD
jgi:CYTH domain-containing protein